MGARRSIGPSGPTRSHGSPRVGRKPAASRPGRACAISLPRSSVLTVRAGASGSHRGKGWEAVTEQAIRALVARGGPLVAILWGRDAGSLRPLLGKTPVIASVHPSPLSASGGFFGSRPFSRANLLLAEQGAPPVDWRLDG